MIFTDRLPGNSGHDPKPTGLPDKLDKIEIDMIEWGLFSVKI